jgi:hypothetical protein
MLEEDSQRGEPITSVDWRKAVPFAGMRLRPERASVAFAPGQFIGTVLIFGGAGTRA